VCYFSEFTIFRVGKRFQFTDVIANRMHAGHCRPTTVDQVSVKHIGSDGQRLIVPFGILLLNYTKRFTDYKILLEVRGKLVYFS